LAQAFLRLLYLLLEPSLISFFLLQAYLQLIFRLSASARFALALILKQWPHLLRLPLSAGLLALQASTN
jgi:hypothetical protein